MPADLGNTGRGKSICLTVQEPWASLLVDGVKDVENRTWRPAAAAIGWPLLIHAGKRYDADGADWISFWCPDVSVPTKAECALGAIIGQVILARVVDDELSRWAAIDQYHWCVSDPRRFRNPVPARGALGLWRPEQETLEAVVGVLA